MKPKTVEDYKNAIFDVANRKYRIHKLAKEHGFEELSKRLFGDYLAISDLLVSLDLFDEFLVYSRQVTTVGGRKS